MPSPTFARALAYALLTAGTPALAQQDGGPATPLQAAEATPPASAPEAGDGADRAQDVSEVSLDELLDVELSVASRKLLSQRESPGILSVITREDIVNTGARDLIDILRLVPGFDFGVDLANVVGLGFRGNWGHEGKVLLLVDGLEMNEPLYSTLQFGNELPVEQIERVEIIRGPGSAIYGGYAELAVINVITRGARLNGASLTGTIGIMPKALGTRRVGFQLGDQFGGPNGVSVSLAGAMGAGTRSDRVYTDVYGSSFNMADSSGQGPTYLNLGVGWRGLRVRLMLHELRVETRDGFEVVLPTKDELSFSSYFADLAYDFKPFGGLVVTPRVTFKRQLPWKSENVLSPAYYTKTADRLVTGLSASYDVLENLNLQVGVEGTFDFARVNSLELLGSQSLFNETEEAVSYQTFATYAQVLYPNEWVNLTVGARYELHSAFGSSFAPRAGLTKVIGPFHFKALYANAFRNPGIENISLSETISPERTQVIEAEAGFQVTDNLYVGVNGYDITIRNPIVYFYDADTLGEGYRNYVRTGTRGLEAQILARYGFGTAKVGYSFYATGGKNLVASYEVPGRDDLLLALPAHKLTAQASVRFLEGFTFTPSLIFLSQRYGFDQVDEDENLVVAELPPVLIVNLFLTKTNLFGERGLEASVGVHNLLGAPIDYIQPYDGYHAPLPGPRQEFMLRLGYTLDFGI